MRKLLRSLRSSSSFSLLRPRPSSSGDGDEEEQEEVRVSRKTVDASQFEDSNHEEDEEIQKSTKLIAKTRCSSNNDNTLASTAKKAQSTDEDLAHMSLEQLMRITKQDTKKERRYKYKQSFVRNNTVMVSLQQQNRNQCYLVFHASLYFTLFRSASFHPGRRSPKRIVHSIKRMTGRRKRELSCILIPTCTKALLQSHAVTIPPSLTAASFAWRSTKQANALFGVTSASMFFTANALSSILTKFNERWRIHHALVVEQPTQIWRSRFEPRTAPVADVEYRRQLAPSLQEFHGSVGTDREKPLMASKWVSNMLVGCHHHMAWMNHWHHYEIKLSNFLLFRWAHNYQ